MCICRYYILGLLPAGVPPEILDLPHLPKMYFYPIFRHKNTILPPVLAFFSPQKSLNLKKKPTFIDT